jgi:hypothetical protein
MQAVYKELFNDTEFMYQFEKEYERRKEKIRAKKRESALYYLKQKVSGLVLVIISVLIPIVMDGDATASILTMPLGLFLLFAKEKIMDFKGK